MKVSSYKQFEVIREKSPEAFTEKLNKKMYELRHNFPEVKITEADCSLIAQISYVETERSAEDLADVYEMQNVRFTCQDCPMFKPILNKDGTPNLRVKYGKCQYAEYGRTYKDSRCCDMLYALLRNGTVQLVIADLED